MVMMNGILQNEMKALLASTVLILGCSSSSSSQSKQVTCDIIKNCDPTGVSLEAGLCPARISDPHCASAYKTWLQCEYSDCTDAGATASTCSSQLDAWRLCRADLPPDAGG